MKLRNYLLIVLVIFSLIGCGGSGNKEGPKKDDKDKTTDVGGPTSDKNIEAIKTNEEYLKMHKLIIDEYLVKYEKAVKDKPNYADIDQEKKKLYLYHESIVEMMGDKISNPIERLDEKIDSLKFYRDHFNNTLKDIK